CMCVSCLFRAPCFTVLDSLSLHDALPIYGRLLVVDRHAGRLCIFSADGAIDTVIGRFGEGPGEFRQPNAAAVGLDGRILVTQATPRVTLLTPDGSVERIGTLPGWLAGDMEPLGSGFVGYISKYGWEDRRVGKECRCRGTPHES